MDYKQRIGYLVTALGQGKNATFADRIEQNRSVVTRARKGAQKLSKKSLEKLASNCSVNTEWVKTGTGEPFNDLSWFDTQGKRLSYVRAEFDWKRKDLTALMEWPERRFIRLENDKAELKPDLAEQIISKITDKRQGNRKLNKEWLLNGIGYPFQGQGPLRMDKNETVVDVPHILELTETRETRYTSFSLNLLSEKTADNQKDCFHLYRIRDDSMSPYFNKRDLVLLDHSQYKPISDHLFVVRIGHDYMLRRIERMNDQIKFIAYNNLSSDRILEEDSGEFEIIGRVIWFCRDL